jgi:hypothetical protein
MYSEIVYSYFNGRAWAATALILLVITMVSFVVSVQVLGGMHIQLSYAAQNSAPRWSVIYMRIIGYLCLAAAAIDVIGLIRDKRKAMAWIVLVVCVLSFAALGSATE